MLSLETKPFFKPAACWPLMLLAVVALLMPGKAFAAKDPFMVRLSVNMPAVGNSDPFIGPYINAGLAVAPYDGMEGYVSMQYGVGRDGKKVTLGFYDFQAISFYFSGFDLALSRMTHKESAKPDTYALEIGAMVWFAKVNLVMSRHAAALEIGVGI